ncbi:phosphoribosylglycinamide formyltransferase [Terrabacter sp. Root85]|uniref:MmcQ/YjbR family DNA-binding protein n=1 Tax=Terrabacter sp. Root85 TaxID=1736603 RepID=UPI0006F59344|nr:phosphoribosylglycinamide formyltransferase [Terrabacter sp. Root85]
MAHPLMFDGADPYLARVREICLALPGADEKVSHGRPSFFTTKVFVTYGGTVKGDHDPEPYRQSVLVLPDAAERPALLGDGRFYDPAYVGPSGWVGLDLRACGPPEEVDWQEVAELVDASYRLTAPPRLVRELDAG